MSNKLTKWDRESLLTHLPTVLHHSTQKWFARDVRVIIRTKVKKDDFSTKKVDLGFKYGDKTSERISIQKAS